MRGTSCICEVGITLPSLQVKKEAQWLVPKRPSSCLWPHRLRLWEGTDSVYGSGRLSCNMWRTSCDMLCKHPNLFPEPGISQRKVSCCRFPRSCNTFSNSAWGRGIYVKKAVCRRPGLSLWRDCPDPPLPVVVALCPPTIHVLKS